MAWHPYTNLGTKNSTHILTANGRIDYSAAVNRDWLELSDLRFEGLNDGRSILPASMRADGRFNWFLIAISLSDRFWEWEIVVYSRLEA